MYADRRFRGPSLIGCAATLLLILVVVVLAVGWFRGWYEVSGRDGDQDMEVGVRIHKEEVGRDLGKMRDETQRLMESAQVAAELSTMEGTVSGLSSSELTVRVGERDQSVAIDDVTEYYRGNTQVELQSIQQGDQVRVIYQESDAGKRASRVTLLQDEQQSQTPN